MQFSYTRRDLRTNILFVIMSVYIYFHFVILSVYTSLSLCLLGCLYLFSFCLLDCLYKSVCLLCWLSVFFYCLSFWLSFILLHWLSRLARHFDSLSPWLSVCLSPCLRFDSMTQPTRSTNSEKIHQVTVLNFQKTFNIKTISVAHC